jgi:hypothetical protein
VVIDSRGKDWKPPRIEFATGFKKNETKNREEPKIVKKEERQRIKNRIYKRNGKACKNDSGPSNKSLELIPE